MDRAEWLEERKKGIGGSDAAATLGVDPWKDALALWSEKVGLTEHCDLSDNEAVQAGIELERAIGEWYGRKHGIEVVFPAPYTITRHPTLPFMCATLDATEVRPGGNVAVVQIKNTSYAPDAWEESLPINYEVQLQHEMVVAGVEHGTLVALHRGQCLRAYPRTRNEELIDKLIAAEMTFWDYVKSQTPPPAGPCSGDVVKAMFPKVEIEDIVPLTPEADDLDAELQEVKKRLDELSARREAIESQLKMWIGSHAGGLTPQGVKFSWRGSEVNYKPQAARTAYVRRFTRSAR